MHKCNIINKLRNSLHSLQSSTPSKAPLPSKFHSLQSSTPSTKAPLPPPRKFLQLISNLNEVKFTSFFSLLVEKIRGLSWTIN